MKIRFHDNELILDHRRAIFYEKQKVLILADLHIGKSAHFRKSGFSMPGMVLEHDLSRLADLIDDYSPESVYILGDLFHSDFNKEFIKWDEFLQNYPTIQFRLILGNHDEVSLKQQTQKTNQTAVRKEKLGDFLLTHHPDEEKGKLNLCGHIHPGVVLSGKGRQKIKMACFWQQEQRIVLPAFSHLTGLGIVKPVKADRVFICTTEEIIVC